jgi:hypothetical protein
MSGDREYDAVRKEVEAILRQYGIHAPNQSSAFSHPHLNADELRIVRDVANRIIHGKIDKNEITNLNKMLADEIPVMVQYLMSLKNRSPIRGIQETNPYYEPFSSKVVRDMT